MDEVETASAEELRAIVLALCKDERIEKRVDDHITKLREAKANTSKTGDMELDYDDPTWDDWDERCHGTMDTKENQEQYPDGFIWDCCEKEGTDPGCTKGHHYAIEGKRMKSTSDGDSVSDGNNDQSDIEDEGETAANDG